MDTAQDTRNLKLSRCEARLLRDSIKDYVREQHDSMKYLVLTSNKEHAILSKLSEMLETLTLIARRLE